MLIWSLLLFSQMSFGFKGMPASTPAQQEARALIEKGQWQQALVVWPTSYENSGYAQSVGGRSVWLYLISQNGMNHAALEELLKLKPNQVPSELKDAWKKSFPASHPIWKEVSIEPSAAWKKVFPFTTSADRLWQEINLAIKKDRADVALHQLKVLSEMGQESISRHLISLTRGRILFGRGELEAALVEYQKIPRGDDYWFQAMEEIAWIHMRKAEYGKAIGQVKNIILPLWSPFISAEPYFVQALANLRICNYLEVFKSTQLMRQRLKDRSKNLEELMSNQWTNAAKKTLDKIDQTGNSTAEFQVHIQQLPPLFWRDKEFNRWAEVRFAAVQETKAVAKLKKQTLGQSAQWDQVVSSANSRAELAKKKVFKRWQELAALELKDMKNIVQKMHIAEAQVIQNMYMTDENQKARNTRKIQRSQDDLVFPVDDELWIDEVGHYKVEVKDCPTYKEASL